MQTKISSPKSEMFQAKGHRAKVKRLHHEVAPLHPLKNIPAKLKLFKLEIWPHITLNSSDQSHKAKVKSDTMAHYDSAELHSLRDIFLPNLNFFYLMVL